jgi:PAS domain S-box-containing protein
LSEKPKILCVTTQREGQELPPALTESFQVVTANNPIRALARLTHEPFAGVLVFSEHFKDALRIGRLLRNEQILEGMPDGVVLLDSNNHIVWANDQMRRWAGREEITGISFYDALSQPEILGPDYCPFHTALATGTPSSSTLRVGDNRYYHVHSAPVIDEAEHPSQLIVTVRDVTEEILQQQKLRAIHKAGVELADISPEEVLEMTIEDRVELLKSNILQHTQDLLNFDVVEIRMLNQSTNCLEPLLSMGIDEHAAQRALYARPQSNGVTGFVAATGKSYLCENTAEDPLYLTGFKGAKSSLTVPLIWHDQVIGTFNVESPEPRAFTESDLQFLEIFSRDVAGALNTLDLLVAQQANAAMQSCEAIHRAVALPVDEILNDAVNVMERYLGHDSELVERLQHILLNARDIKKVIQKVGQTLTPAEAVPSQFDDRLRFAGRRVLVVDEDNDVRGDAHDLLERYGAIVETAHEGSEAMMMVRAGGKEHGYDVVISDIKLPDFSGYQLMLRLGEVMSPVPIILMTGFGYDPGHSIVKARQAGLHANAILYKPFRREQLLTAVETVLEASGKAQQA